MRHTVGVGRRDRGTLASGNGFAGPRRGFGCGNRETQIGVMDGVHTFSVDAYHAAFTDDRLVAVPCLLIASTRETHCWLVRAAPSAR